MIGHGYRAPYPASVHVQEGYPTLAAAFRQRFRFARFMGEHFRPCVTAINRAIQGDIMGTSARTKVYQGIAIV